MMGVTSSCGEGVREQCQIVKLKDSIIGRTGIMRAKDRHESGVQRLGEWIGTALHSA